MAFSRETFVKVTKPLKDLKDWFESLQEYSPPTDEEEIEKRRDEWYQLRYCHGHYNAIPPHRGIR